MAAWIDIPGVSLAHLATAALAAAVAWRWAPARWPLRAVAVLALALMLLVPLLLTVAGVLPVDGRLRLTGYTGFLLAGFGAAYIMVRPGAAALGLDGLQLRRLFVIALVLGIVGARVRYVAERWDAVMMDAEGHPLAGWEALARAVDLEQGGAVWYGGLTLALLGVAIALVWWRVRLLPFFDLAAPGLLVGLGIGRIGCFFNGCCYGAACDLPWAVASPRWPHGPSHPTQLYETAFCVTWGLGLWALRSRLQVRHPDPAHQPLAGMVLSLAAVGYGLWRFLNESLRGDHDAFTRFAGIPMTTSQATSIELVLGTVVATMVVTVWRWWCSAVPAGIPAAVRSGPDGQMDGAPSPDAPMPPAGLPLPPAAADPAPQP